jgi:hypothetical protein
LFLKKKFKAKEDRGDPRFGCHPDQQEAGLEPDEGEASGSLLEEEAEPFTGDCSSFIAELVAAGC